MAQLSKPPGTDPGTRTLPWMKVLFTLLLAVLISVGSIIGKVTEKGKKFQYNFVGCMLLGEALKMSVSVIGLARQVVRKEYVIKLAWRENLV